MTTGYTSASIAYDLDVRPAHRRCRPSFYGYVPDKSILRTLVFVCLALNSALLLLLQSFSCALLILANANYLLAYLAGDMALYFVWKLARNEFMYFVRLYGRGGCLAAVLLRTTDKLLLNFTGLVHWRNPSMMGGTAWMASITTTICWAFASVHLYFTTAKEGPRALEEATAWTLVSSLSGAWLLVFAVFFLFLIKREYRRTFYTTMTAREGIQHDLYDVEGSFVDERCAELVSKFNMHWWTELRPQMRTHLAINWARWEVEKPEWFSPAWTGSVDDDLLPAAVLVKQKVEGGGHRRRSSFGLLGGNAAVAPAT